MAPRRFRAFVPPTGRLVAAVASPLTRLSGPRSDMPPPHTLVVCNRLTSATHNQPAGDCACWWRPLLAAIPHQQVVFESSAAVSARLEHWSGQELVPFLHHVSCAVPLLACLRLSVVPDAWQHQVVSTRQQRRAYWSHTIPINSCFPTVGLHSRGTAGMVSMHEYEPRNRAFNLQWSAV